MYAKFVLFAIFISCAISAPTGEHQYEEDNHVEEYSHHEPQYNYKYGVEDHHTGDMKCHEEHREGDLVKGEYSFVQPDGKTRIVTYASDKHGGFHAYVTYFGGDDVETSHH